VSIVDKYIDKATIFILCAVFYIDYKMDIYIIVPIICVIIISALMSYLDDERLKGLTALVFFILCAVYPVFLFFLPLVIYDLFYTKYPTESSSRLCP
jgi:hypothetical protein